MGGRNMNANQRKKRRQKIRELTMYLLEQNERGMSFQYLQTTVDNCVRYRVSRHSLAKVMKPELETGIIISELDRDRKTVWKLSSAYRTTMETV
jgi:hypothetical protein